MDPSSCQVVTRSRHITFSLQVRLSHRAATTAQFTEPEMD